MRRNEPTSRHRPNAIRRACAVLVVAFAIGCERAVLIDDGAPVRLSRPTPARVFYRDGDTWRETAGEVVVPAGWWLVPPRFVEDDEGAMQ